ACSFRPAMPLREWRPRRELHPRFSETFSAASVKSFQTLARHASASVIRIAEAPQSWPTMESMSKDQPADLVLLTRHQDIGVITLNNPPVNALSPGVPEGIVRGIAEF